MHVEARDLDEEARPGERALLVVVVANHVAHVLAQEALDALVELLDAIDVLLHHPVGAIGLRRLEAQRRHLLGLVVVEGHVGDEIADQREGPDRRHRDRVARPEQVHPRHAHEPWLAVDLGAARAALAGLAVPATGKVVGLSRLDPVDHVEDDHALLVRDARCLNDSIRFKASRSSCSVRIRPTKLCIVSCRSAWMAYGFSPPVRVNGSSISRASDSTWLDSIVSEPPKSLA